MHELADLLHRAMAALWGVHLENRRRNHLLNPHEDLPNEFCVDQFGQKIAVTIWYPNRDLVGVWVISDGGWGFSFRSQYSILGGDVADVVVIELALIEQFLILGELAD